jgi:hypothetical protein
MGSGCLSTLRSHCDLFREKFYNTETVNILCAYAKVARSLRYVTITVNALRQVPWHRGRFWTERDIGCSSLSPPGEYRRQVSLETRPWSSVRRRLM